MYFHRSNRDTSNVIMKMKIFPLQVSKSVKFLGIIFDNSLILIIIDYIFVINCLKMLEF